MQALKTWAVRGCTLKPFSVTWPKSRTPSSSSKIPHQLRDPHQTVDPEKGLPFR
ncbi:Hypothetical predicted protein, partial [Podarcis lilfordi]